MIYLISLGLICLSALFSGLTLGLMGLDVYELKRKMKLGDELAAKVYRVRKNGNLLLTTLLLGNVAVNAALSIFLGSIATGFIAGLIATGLIFIFGEIIPQAVISRHALLFGARTSRLVQLLIFILLPVTYPIAWSLNKILGQEIRTIYSKKELLSVIEEHEDSTDSDIDRDEERIIKGALTFSHKTVSQVMTPASVCLSVSINDKLTPQLQKRLRSSGHSRIPVFDERGEKVRGILFLKDLIGRTMRGKVVKDYYRRDFFKVDVEETLDDALNFFLRSKSHLSIVEDECGDFVGIITVEDILEEIVGREIVDEFDKVKDMRKLAREKKRAK